MLVALVRSRILWFCCGTAWERPNQSMLMFTGVQQLLTGCLLNFSAWMEMFAQAQAWIFHECMPACMCVCLEARTKVDVCPTHPSPLFFSEGEREVGGGGEIQIGMIYSFRPLPLMKGCRWMTYHLTVDTIITPMSEKPSNYDVLDYVLTMTVCLNYELGIWT